MKKNISNKKLREFGFIFLIFLLVISRLFYSVFFIDKFLIFILFLIVPFLCLCIFWPDKLLYLYNFWIYLGNILGKINSRIILGLVFILILIPTSLIMRLLGHDPLRKKFNKSNSYRESKKGYKDDLTKIF